MAKKERLDDSLEQLDLEAGLEAAFDGEQGSHSVDVSVLAQLSEDGPELVPILLRDPESNADLTPVVRPGGGKIRGRQGRYQVLGEIARGGVGVVFRGHDIDLGRDVAMKVIRDEHRDTPEIIQRFVEEAQIGGQLQHPGIVPVYEIGLGKDRHPYFTMKLIKGKTLSALLSRRNSPREQRRRMLSIFESVCQTMAYAHARGVIHRDLKPSNVMVGAFGEVLVVDWGMGKVLRQGGVADEREAKRKAEQTIVTTLRSGGEGSASVVGSVMGTPRYMSPEQARGDIENVDERSDVFGLGAVLCEILTGAPPYSGEDNEVFVQASMAKLDDAYSRLDRCGADKELIEICRRCLTPAVEARPQTAGELAKLIGGHISAAEDRAEKTKLAAVRAEERAEAERAEASAARAIAKQERAAATQARRARRLTLALASVAVLLVAAGAGLWLQRQQERATAQAATARGVNAALQRAGLIAEEAESEQELELWERALAAAEDASRLLVEGDATPELRRRVEDTLQRIEPRAKLAAEVIGKEDRAKRLAADDDMEGALAEYGAIVKLMPGYADGYDRMGRLLTVEKRTGEAVEAFKKALACKETDTYMRDLTFALVDHGDLEAARAMARRAADRYPNEALVYNTLGNITLVSQWAERMRLYRRALQADPTYKPSTANLYRAYSEAVERGEARVLTGDLLPPEGRWRLHIAIQCAGKRPADCVRFFELAFQAKPSLEESVSYGNNHRILVATNALIALTKSGVAEKERERLRTKALAWMEAHVEAWASVLEEGTPDDGINVLSGLFHRGRNVRWALSSAQAFGLTSDQVRRLKALAAKVAELRRSATRKVGLDMKPETVAQRMLPETLVILAGQVLSLDRHERALELYELAFHREPALAKHAEHAYNAACATLRTAAQDPRSDGSDSLRREALDYLTSSLAAYEKDLQSGGNAARIAAASLRWWEQDPDLDSVRGAKSSGLAPAQQPGWEALWVRWRTALSAGENSTR